MLKNMQWSRASPEQVAASKFKIRVWSTRTKQQHAKLFFFFFYKLILNAGGIAVMQKRRPVGIKPRSDLKKAEHNISFSFVPL